VHCELLLLTSAICPHRLYLPLTLPPGVAASRAARCNCQSRPEAAEASQESGSFLKKRTKKLLFSNGLWLVQRACKAAQVFAAFFNKKRFLAGAPVSVNAG
jgi:hypothetical protein